MSFQFEILHLDALSSARCARFSTPHGTVETPAFMPVGTQATVKGISPQQVEQVGAKMILANTYHLALRPGSEIISSLGGLHRFMGWNGPILTDSGGFQIFSLESERTITDRSVVFRSHIDGSVFDLSPERAITIQEELGADVMMCLDHCPAADLPAVEQADAVRRTVIWAQRCARAKRRTDQALFTIVQGGLHKQLRSDCAEALVDMDFSGYALGGLSVGETPEQMYEIVEFTTPLLPQNKPRYLMGVGRPQDIVEAVDRGMDLFDCVMPTRNGRNAMAFTSSGNLRLRNRCHRDDDRPLDSQCNCMTCRTFSRAYLRHLFQAGEMLGPILLSIHNLAFYQQLMRNIRSAIGQGLWREWCRQWKKDYLGLE